MNIRENFPKRLKFYYDLFVKWPRNHSHCVELCFITGNLVFKQFNMILVRGKFGLSVFTDEKNSLASSIYYNLSMCTLTSELNLQLIDNLERVTTDL